MRRRRLVLAAIIAIAVLLSVPAMAASIRLLVNGAEIVPDVAPQNIDGRVLVPLRTVAETLGYDVAWHPAEQAVTVCRGGESFALPDLLDPAYIHLFVNGVELQPDVPPRVIAGRTMVPIRAVAEALGIEVAWDESYRAVIVGPLALSLSTLAAGAPADPGPSGGSSATVTVYITKTGEKYHRAGCRYLAKSCIAIGLADAKAAGYGPCSVCGPPK